MAVHAFSREHSSRAHTYEKDHKQNEPGDLRLFSCSTGLCIKLESKAQKCASLHRNGTTWSRADAAAPLQAKQQKVRGALTSATGTPSGGRQCSTIMPFRCTSVPWGSCSKFFLRSEGEKNKKQAWNALLHAYINIQDFGSIRGLRSLTGDSHGCLAALGGPQVAPGDTQTPVILRAMKIFHLLTWHVDHHFTDFQPCEWESGYLW